MAKPSQFTKPFVSLYRRRTNLDLRGPKRREIDAPDRIAAELAKQTIECREFQLFGGGDFYAKWTPARVQIDDHAGINASSANAPRPLLAGKVEVCRQWLAMPIRDFEIRVFHDSTG